jgi:hypothetical protein
LSFDAPRSFERAWSITAGDFNRDGKLDLGEAARTNGEVAVQLGAGDGTFAPPQSYPAGDTPIDIANGDFNRDGKLDLAVANCGVQCDGSGPGGVSVLLGNGDGTFVAEPGLATGGNPYSVAIADLNRDGKPDLVSANTSGHSVSVFLGNGDGTFAPKTDNATGEATSVAAGDFNNDAKPDLAVGNGDQISVLLGNGAGSFGPRTDYPSAPMPLDVAAGDLDRDGDLDLVAANFLSNTLTVLLGNGDGTFQTGTHPPGCKTAQHGSFCNPSAVAIADFDGDGKPDLVAGLSGAVRVGVLAGNGDGTFAPTRDFDAGANAQSIAAADFDADGRPDIVTSGAVLLNTTEPGPPPTLGVKLTRASVTATSRRLVRLPLRSPNPFAVAGTVTLRTGSKKRPVTLGRSSFAIAASKTSQVRVRLSKAGGALLAKRRKLKVRVALLTQGPSGKPVATSKALLLRAPRRVP